MDIKLININKIRAKSITGVLMILSYLIWAFFFRLEALISIIIYPHAALTSYGVIKIIDAFHEKPTKGHLSVEKILLGII